MGSILTLSRVLFMDYQSTTPCDRAVLDTMIPYFTERFGNPHSRSHAFGWEAEEAVVKARAQVAAVLHADPKTIVFTSGATEANNLAIKGVAMAKAGKKCHFITLKTEHKCVLEAFVSLQAQGHSVTFLSVQTDGLIDLEVLKAAFRPETVLVSIMAVHNELGVIQPLEDIGALCKERGVLFHTDAAQAYGKIPLDVDRMHIDLLSLSGHKIYGPKGMGALYVRRGQPRIRLGALFSGGGQERGMRSGTLPTPLCVGLGAAAELCAELMDSENERLWGLHRRLKELLFSGLEEIYLNGHAERRIPGNLNISFSCVEGESLIMGIPDIAVSSGSACTSESLETSYVLQVIGVDLERAHTSLRIGLGRQTTAEDVEHVGRRLVEEVTRLRVLSPLWDMHQAGIDLKSICWTGH